MPVFCLLLLLPMFALAGEPKSHDFSTVNDHFAATFGGSNPTALNANIAKQFKNAAAFGLSRVPLMAMPEAIIHIAGRDYRVSSLQLVGIVDREKPALYHTPGPPTKETVKQAIVRELLDYELQAVAALKSGKNVEVVAHKHVAFGALRADASCVKCHKGKPGDLFGAFRYSLMPMPKPVMQREPEPKPQAKDQKEPLVSLLAR